MKIIVEVTQNISASNYIIFCYVHAIMTVLMKKTKNQGAILVNQGPGLHCTYHRNSEIPKYLRT